MKCLLHNIYIDKDSLEYATTSMFMESFQTYVIYIYRGIGLLGMLYSI